MIRDTALIVVDVQNDFCPGGALAVPDGEQVVPVINRFAREFETVVLTQDWHPAEHVSFAASHPGRAVFDTVQLDGRPQTLWPTHCVQGTAGAALHAGLQIDHAQLILRKGWRKGVDSYSAFIEGDRQTATGLDGYLRARGLSRIVLCGLATDFCVTWSALDARELGYHVRVYEAGCRAIDLDGSLARAWQAMHAVGVEPWQ